MVDDDGVGLVEVLVAAFLMAVAVLGMASVAGGTLRSLTGSQARQEATTALTRAVESARSLGYDLLALRSGQYTDGEAFDWDGADGDAAPEPLYATLDGLVAQGTYPYFESRVSYSLETRITEHQALRPDGVTVAEPARRVTVIATLANGRGEVRLSTVVARADRGLPLPAFVVTPVSGRRVAVPNASAGTVPETCFPTQLRNQGLADRYEFVLPTPATHPAATTYTIRVYLDRGTVGTHDTADLVLSDRTGNGVYLPDTVDPLATNATATLLFCYQRNNYVAEETVAFPVRARSLFDNDVYSDLEHVVVVDDVLQLYPQFDLGDDPPPTRGGNFPLTSVPPSRTTAVDYDVDGRPGTYLKRKDPAYVALFTTDLPAGVTLGGNVSTSMWVASANSTAVGATPASRTIRLGYALQVLNSAGAIVRTVTVIPPEFVHGGGGWARQDLTFALPDHVAATGDRLRLSVTCQDTSVATGSKSDCHILYDTVATPATVVVPLR